MISALLACTGSRTFHVPTVSLLPEAGVVWACTCTAPDVQLYLNHRCIINTMWLKPLYTGFETCFAPGTVKNTPQSIDFLVLAPF